MIEINYSQLNWPFNYCYMRFYRNGFFGLD